MIAVPFSHEIGLPIMVVSMFSLMELDELIKSKFAIKSLLHASAHTLISTMNDSSHRG